ncbi:PLC-like phosphodiesterase [Pterulicium gracile]|uniref:PLC-like phosphodiesterase n=1 Tax=Pterulicium gracile TaxID=1884261 RepID=A0A5C3QEV2_9AGAR|nr:PLC-like phosphodiesterase [Pterula gracilis]
MPRLALVAALFASYAAPVRGQCNGSPALCERGYGTVSFVGTHNSYAVGSEDNLAVNQGHDVTQQLNDGVRMLQVQAHTKGTTIQLCHTSCDLLDGGSLLDYLRKVKTWMDANPQEVVSMLIVNIRNQPPTAFSSIFTQAGLADLAYTPVAPSVAVADWPTLGSMIESGKRLVIFMDNQAQYDVVSWIIDEFSNMWETGFNIVDPTLFNCQVNRTSGDPSTQLALINHFLNQVVVSFPAPFPERANVTNAATGEGSLGAEVGVCGEVIGRAPNFMLVDFYEYGGGSVFEVAASANGVTYNPTTPIAQPGGSSGGSTNGAGGTGTRDSAAASVFVPGSWMVSSLVLGGLGAALL